jgi:oligopeptide/dipeptide ABC transporter ATP-binding protein
MVEKVGLTRDHLYRLPHEFSGGQRQRIGVARALVLHPSFVVLDEPTSALDVSVQVQILNLLKDLQAEMQLTYLFISHDLSVVKYMSNRMAVMYLGKIVEIGSAEELFNNPTHPYTKALISSIPPPDPNVSLKSVLLKGETDVPSPVNPPSGCRFHTRCPIAKPICSKKEPELLQFSKGHFVACPEVV